MTVTAYATDYVIEVANIGQTTASTGYLNFFWYEEEAYVK